jgi:hypothetical protein
MGLSSSGLWSLPVWSFVGNEEMDWHLGTSWFVRQGLTLGSVTSLERTSATLFVDGAMDVFGLKTMGPMFLSAR